MAYLSASMFLFGGALNGWESLVHILPIAAITFFAMLARELLKAAEDVEGDRMGGADTLPIRFGVLPTVRLAFICAVTCGCHEHLTVPLVGGMVSCRDLYRRHHHMRRRV